MRNDELGRGLQGKAFGFNIPSVAYGFAKSAGDATTLANPKPGHVPFLAVLCRCGIRIVYQAEWDRIQANSA